MRPVVWFLLVVGVPQMGVALTLALPRLDCPEATPLVYVAGGAWALVAWHAARKRAKAVLPVEAWWVKRFYLLPLAVCLVGALTHDHAVAAGCRALSGVEARAGNPPAGPAAAWQPAASPARNAPPLREVGALLSAVLSRAVRFVLGLVVSVPFPWWGAAVLIAAWKGKDK